MSTEYVNGRRNELSTKADFEASQRKFSEVVNFLGECQHKELIEDPKTGEYFYHLLTKKGEETIVKFRYIIDCFKECQENCKKLRKYQSKMIDELNLTTLDIMKTCSEEIKNMKNLIGTS